jgi:hypothetical protein
METTHDLLRIALKHLDNDTFTAPASVPLILADQNPVPMEHLAHLTRIQEKIVALAVRHHETEAVTMTLDVSTGEVGFGDRQIRAPTVTDQLTVPGHGNKPATQPFNKLFIIEIKFFAKLLMGSGRAAFLEVFQNHFTAVYGPFVLLSFALSVRVVLKGS